MAIKNMRNRITLTEVFGQLLVCNCNQHFTLLDNSDSRIAILFDTSLDTPIGISLHQFDCNLNASAADTSQSLSLLLGSRILPAAQQRHQCKAAGGGTTTISEFGVSLTVRCTVNVNTAVHSYRDESLQP